MRILAVESSTTVCSVALCDGEDLLSVREVNDGFNHAKLLTGFIEEVLDETGCDPSDLSGVAVSKGPGSYTGLRIGVSAAKGICFAHNIPLIGVSALEAMALTVSGDYSEEDLLVPMIDAGRMEVYTSVFTSDMKEVESLSAKIIDNTSFNHFKCRGKIVLLGNGASKTREMFHGDDRIIIRDDIFPSAKLICPIANKKILHSDFEDLAYFEPHYLKEFIAGKPKVKGLF